MPGRLNIFQKSMLQWSEMHPYNAVHVARFRGALDPERLRCSVNRTLTRRGLSRLKLDRVQCNFEYEPGPSDCDLRIVSGDPGDDLRGAMIKEMERELNREFAPAPAFSPFRFLAASDTDSFYFGLVYFHPVADAESIACLLKEIVTSYAGPDARETVEAPPLDLYPESRALLLRRRPLVVVRKLLGMPAQIRNLRQSHRARYESADNMANGFVCFSVEPEDLRSLIAAAKRWGVTINDLFIALLMKCVSPCAAGRVRARRRRKISIGCIVNLRKELGVDSRKTFGLFLGSFAVTHEVPEGIGVRELARDIQQQTSAVKRRKLPLATPIELGFSRLMLALHSPARRKKFYAKHYPLWGGVTNMNLNALWNPGAANELLDYLRGVSTGPATPLVLSATTVGERVNLGLSYRTAVFSRSDVETFQVHFGEHLKQALDVA